MCRVMVGASCKNKAGRRDKECQSYIIYRVVVKPE